MIQKKEKNENEQEPADFEEICRDDDDWDFALGSQIVNLFEKWLPSLCHDFAVVGCISSVDTEIFEHAKEHCANHVDALKRVARQLFHHDGATDNALDQHAADCVEQFLFFWSQQGFFSEKEIWMSRHRKFG